MTVTIGSLFAGYGGLDLAIQAVFPDATTLWVSEIDKAANKVLTHRFPHAKNLGDITQIDWSQVEPVDIICGGSPCQDLSVAGRHAGMASDTRSGLWKSMAKAIHHLQPSLVIWENVHGALTAPAYSSLGEKLGLLDYSPAQPTLRAAGRVAGDLANIGYDTQWCTLSASSIGACHQRTRIFLTAHPAPRSRGCSNGESSDSTPHADSKSRRKRVTRHGTARPYYQPRGSGRAYSHHSLREKAAAYQRALHIWEETSGLPQPPPLETSPRGKQRLSARFVEWMMGLPAGWVTDIPGLSRTDCLRLLGNGVVPQQAAAALQILLSEECMGRLWPHSPHPFLLPAGQLATAAAIAETHTPQKGSSNG